MQITDSVDPAFYYASGFRNENVFILPNQDLVIARFAMPPLVSFGWNMQAFVTGVMGCVGPSQ